MGWSMRFAVGSLCLVLLAACGGGDSDERSSEVGARELAATRSVRDRGPAPTTGSPPARTARPEGAATTPGQAPATQPEAAQGGSAPRPAAVPPGAVPKTRAPAKPTTRERARLAVAAKLAQRRLFVGFQDDPSFRWVDDRGKMLDRARDAGATVIRTTVEWRRVAPKRPRRPADPFDPAYRFENVDELVRSTQQRGIELLLTIWGTPEWANGGLGPNRAPRRLRDLRDFAHALAARYSGAHGGYPFVRFYSVWNEPNLEQFLAPQFDGRGRSVAPVLYAKLFRFAAAGIRAGSPDALVAAGETSPRGRDHPTTQNVQDSHAPGTFARLVAQVAPDLPFDAWAHHPYPTALRRPPTQVARWPNVALVQLPQLGRSLDRWFGRKDVPLWVTEYAYQTRPHDPEGVTPPTQAKWAAAALEAAAGNPRVEMFVWFTFRDDQGNPWQSGLVGKPALTTFTRSAWPLDARVQIERLVPGGAILRLGVREFAHFSPAGSPVGVTYQLVGGRRLQGDGQPEVQLERDGWITIRVPLRPQSGRSYRIQVVANDRHGNVVRRRLSLVGL